MSERDEKMQARYIKHLEHKRDNYLSLADEVRGLIVDAQEILEKMKNKSSGVWG